MPTTAQQTEHAHADPGAPAAPTSTPVENPRDTEGKDGYRSTMARPARSAVAPAKATSKAPVLAAAPPPATTAPMTPATTPATTTGPSQVVPLAVPLAEHPLHYYASMGPLALRVEASAAGPVCLVGAASLVAWLPSQNIACTADRIHKIVAEAKAHPKLAAEFGRGPEGLLTERAARVVIASLGAGLAGALAEDALALAFGRASEGLRVLLHSAAGAEASPAGTDASATHRGATSGAAPRPPAKADNPLTKGPTTTDLALEERAQIVEALRKARQNRTEAARLLGIPRRSFYRKLRDYGIVTD